MNNNCGPRKTEKTVYTLLVTLFLAFLFWCPAFSTTLQKEDGSISSGAFKDTKEFNEKYRPISIAQRLREIKQQKELAVKEGRTYANNVVTFNVPVIMGSFSDNAHIISSADFEELLFGAYPTGSMTDYYDEVSYGQFQLTGTVHGPYTAANTQAYYMNGDNGGGTDYPTNYAGFLYSVLDDADPTVDFGLYDNDGPDGIPNSGDDDGVVDALIMIHADGSEATGDTDNFRARFSFLDWHGAPPYTTDDAAAGGGFILIDQQLRVGGERGNGNVNMIQLIGIFCHEFGHALGLPDLYDTDESSGGLGTWCLMSSSFGACGCAGGGARPVHLNAWCKVDLGWIIPTVIEAIETVQIPPVETNPVAYKLWDDAYQGGRYFLLENRTRTGFDSLIEGEGVMIWHCNEEAAFDNGNDNFRIVDLEEADGFDHLDNKINLMDSGDPYPGSSNNTSFNDNTYPSTEDLFGDPTGVSAEGFAYVADPGSDVTVTLTQRNLEGYTLSYQTFAYSLTSWSDDPVNEWGAVRFNASIDGKLVAIQTVTKPSGYTDYAIRLFDDMIGGAPTGLHSTTTGTFPSVSSSRYIEIPLEDSLPLLTDQHFLIDV